MKVHYINVLLFALPLNILVTLCHVHNQRNHKSTTQYTPTTRLLCECELYAPSNYDNDPQMKEVMEIFNKQTQQRFEEYDERMKTTRQKCKEQCDKESQKIILKDKLEKELMDKFATLDTDIQSDAIPTCVCKKSIADKVEKGCLRCVGILGAAMPELGSIGGTALYNLSQWQAEAIATATTAAKEFGTLAGKIVGDAKGTEIVIKILKGWGVDDFCPEIFKSIGITTRYNDSATIISAVIAEHGKTCSVSFSGTAKPICTTIGRSFNIIANSNNTHLPTTAGITKGVTELVGKAEQTATELTKRATEHITKVTLDQETALIEGGFNSTITSINAAIVAIVVIVLIMVIIYLILRYRRKKKMKKKLQYIKLLEE